MLACRPVLSESELREAYPLLVAACERIAQREETPFFAPAVYTEVTERRARMFVVWDGPDAVGCFVCFPLTDPRSSTPKLVVWLAYVVPGGPPEVIRTGLEACKQHALDMGCTHLRFHAKREGWQRVAEGLGYAPVEQVYEKRI